ncbi:glycosyltransferase family 2 protein [Lacibacter sp. H407]|uniref:glycosyltransferase family 2 protein n=1 Tax=Lacibacter sp. H407 TaxID=3133423 RepID=UPI0030BE8C13
MQVPLVTVTALCYNHSRYVTETLESIRQQDYSNLEVIIIDDCSTDDSVLVIQQWLQQHQLNWEFIPHTVNCGVSKSLNEGSDRASGTYLKVIACDDRLLPHCISTLVGELDPLSAEYAMLYANVETIDENGQLFGSTPFEERNWLTDADVPSGKLFAQLAQLCFIPAASTLIRTSVLQALRFDEELHFEDWDMWLRMSKQYLIKGIATPVVQYRIHRTSMYQQKSPAYQDAELRTAEKHLGFDQEADTYLKEYIYRKSISLYMHGGFRPLYWLWQRFLIKKNGKNLLHVLLALAGISYKKKLKWENRFKGV